MEIFLNVLKTKYADFKGRARRQEYWNYMLYLFLFFLISYSLIFIGSIAKINIITYIAAFLVTAVAWLSIIPTIAISVRRLHDTNRSGWYYLIGLIPLVGGILLLVWFCTEGTQGENNFGPDPKGGDEIHQIGDEELV